MDAPKRFIELAAMRSALEELSQTDRDSLRKKAQERAMQKVPREYLGKYRDPEAKKLVKYQVLEVIEEYKPGLDISVRQALAERLTNEISGYGPLERLLDDKEITEILIERWDRVVIEKEGILQETDVRFDSEDHLALIVERMITPLGRRLDYSSPMVDARLPDGSRINAVTPPVAVHGLQVAIRKFKPNLSIEHLIEYGAISPELAQAMKACVQARLSVVVSGGTGSGKSTFLNALAEFIPHHLSIITIENPVELRLNHPRVRSWEAKPPNIEGKGEISQLALVINALRARPDIIIVGEVRGPEAFALLQALNTGHAGSMTTTHANNVADATKRLVSMVASAGQLSPALIPSYVASGIDLIVQLSRMPDGSRRLVEIAEVVGEKGGEIETNPLVRYVIDGYDDQGRVIGRWEETGSRFERMGRLREARVEWPGWLGKGE